jgi:hypothetical protein
MRNWFSCGTIVFALALCGCDSQSLMTAFTPTAESNAGQTYIDDIRKGNFSAVRATIDPAYKDQLTETVLQEIRRLFPASSVRSVKIIGSNTVKSPTAVTYGLTYEYELGGR